MAMAYSGHNGRDRMKTDRKYFFEEIITRQVKLVPVAHLVLPSGVAVCPPPEWAPKNTLPIYATIGFEL